MGVLTSSALGTGGADGVPSEERNPMECTGKLLLSTIMVYT